MPSRIKKTGRAGSLLMEMAQRGGTMLTDYRGFPPSKVMLPLEGRGLVTLRRTGLPKSRRNIWHLTPKGWDAIQQSPPAQTAPADQE